MINIFLQPFLLLLQLFYQNFVMHFLSSQKSIFFTEVILQSPNLVEALGKLAGSPSSNDEA
jgi:hypothetical protein